MKMEATNPLAAIPVLMKGTPVLSNIEIVQTVLSP
jgi:hypothetical protein